MKEILDWSSDHDFYPVTMTYTFLGGARVQVDFFTLPEDSPGGLEYAPPATESLTGGTTDDRQLVTYDALELRDQRTTRLFDTAPQAPAREPRSLFGHEVKGSWVTANLVRPSNVRLFLGATEQPLPADEVRAARSRARSTVQRSASTFEAAISDRMLIVIVRSERPEPAWSRIEALIEGSEDDA